MQLRNKWSLKNVKCFKDSKIRLSSLKRNNRNILMILSLISWSLLRLRMRSSRVNTFRFKMPKGMSTLKSEVTSSKTMPKLADR